MPIWKSLLVSIVVLFSTAACQMGADSPRGFSLPEGDLVKGQAAFIALQCTSCHSIQGMDLPAAAEEGPVMIALGGRVATVKTYADLVTSIINPSHRISKAYSSNVVDDAGASVMTNYNDAMSVTELIDIVSFLQPQYELIPVSVTHYPLYDYK